MAELLLAENPRKRGYRNPYAGLNPVEFMEMGNPRRRRGHRRARNPLALRRIMGGSPEDVALQTFGGLGSIAVTTLIGKQITPMLTKNQVPGTTTNLLEVVGLGLSAFAVNYLASAAGLSVGLKQAVHLGAWMVPASKALHTFAGELASQWGLPRFNGATNGATNNTTAMLPRVMARVLPPGQTVDVRVGKPTAFRRPYEL